MTARAMHSSSSARRISTRAAALAILIVAVVLIPAAIAQNPAPQTPSAAPRSSPRSAPAWQTAAGGNMSFEVASIRPGEPGKFTPPSFALSIDDSPVPPGGRFTADFPLPVYIEFAYKMMPTREQRDAMLAHLPAWVATQPFVIEAKTPIANPTKDQVRLMMQSLLADRFKLAVHFETHEMPILAIVLAKPGATGPRLRPHAEGLACDAKLTAPADPTSPSVPPGGFVSICGNVALTRGTNNTFVLGARNLPMEHIALYLPTVYNFGRPVIDQTGLTGTFDFTLSWVPDPDSSPAFLSDSSTDLEGTPFFGALKDQLGLKLKPTRAPVQTLVIDHVEQPSPN